MDKVGLQEEFAIAFSLGVFNGVFFPRRVLYRSILTLKVSSQGICTGALETASTDQSVAFLEEKLTW